MLAPLRPVVEVNDPSATVSDSARTDRLLVQLGQDFANDLGHLVGWEWFAPFGFRHSFGEGLDRVGPTNQHVAQRLPARIGVDDVFERAGNVMVGRLGEGVHDVHRFFSPTRGRDGGGAIGILLKIPLGKSFAITSFTGMQQPSRRFSDHVNAVAGRSVDCVVTVVLSPLWNRYHQAPVGISDDPHVVTPFGPPFVPVAPNLKGTSRTTIVVDINVRVTVNSALETV